MNSKNAIQIFIVAAFAVAISFGAVSQVEAAWTSGGANTSTGTCCTTTSGSTVSSKPTSGWTSGGANTTTGTCCTTTSAKATVTTKSTTGTWTSGGANTTTGTCCTTTTVTTGGYTTTGGCVGNCGDIVRYPQPSCDISVSRNSINAGESVTVSWNSSNATSRTITNIGSGLAASGSATFNLNNTTTFTGTFSGQGGTVTCSKTVVVNIPQPTPTCNMYGNPSSINPGQSAVINWNSSNVNNVSINNVGSGLSANGSQTVYPNQTTTYTGTFYGSNGQSTTCSTTIYVNQVNYNNPSCTITINNYGTNYNNGYWQPNSAVTISWSSANASWGTINQGLGNVNLNGSRTVYPNQTTTYTGTFYGQSGQSVTCSATVYVGGYVPPVNPGTPYVTLSSTPYTGLELGPVGTVVYWGFIAFWCLLAAYLIAVKRVQNNVYASLSSLLFGTKQVTHAAAAHAAPAHGVHVSYVAPAHEDKTDDFVLSQINRTR